MSRTPESRADLVYIAEVRGTVHFSNTAESFVEPQGATFRLSGDRRSFRVRFDSSQYPGFWAEARISASLYHPDTDTVTLRAQIGGGRLTDASISEDGEWVLFREDQVPDSGAHAAVRIPDAVRAMLVIYHSTRPTLSA